MAMSKQYQVPYHGPHVVFSREEIERLREVMEVHLWKTAVDSSICGKLDAALKSHPDFLTPAK